METNKVTVPELIQAVKYYYSLEGNQCGGSLHIVLDDDNIEDSHIEMCIRYANKRNDMEGIKLGKMLLAASYNQRKKLLKRYNEFVE